MLTRFGMQRRLILGAAILALGIGTASAQPAESQHPSTTAVPVAADAPLGGSRQVAIGGAIGVVAGIAILGLILASGG